VLDNFGWLTEISQAMTDHGTQLYANKRHKNGGADSRFENFLKDNKIVHIKVRVKHPRTDGKFEKNRYMFDNFDNFITP